jgi:hypothetical protein
MGQPRGYLVLCCNATVFGEVIRDSKKSQQVSPLQILQGEQVRDVTCGSR